MELYVKDVTEYIEDQCNTFREEENKEIRLCLKSLPAQSVLTILSAIRDNINHDFPQKHTHMVFKVATKLWQEWESFENQELLLQFKNNDWVDFDDKLTEYRNLRLGDNNVNSEAKGLLVILVGSEYASDQGGLADFHYIDEKTIWNVKHEGGYKKWVDVILERVGLQSEFTSENNKDALSGFFKELFAGNRPFDLIKLSCFIDYVLENIIQVANVGELLELFHTQLPFWGIPPLHNISSGNQYKLYLKNAADFIDRVGSFKFDAAKNRRLVGSIDFFQNDEEKFEEFDVPSGFLEDKTIYFNTVKSFVNDNDEKAKALLLQSDIKPLLDIFKINTKKASSSSKESVVSGGCFSAFLQAIFDTINQNRNQVKDVSKIIIRIEAFTHDLGKENADAEEAKKLLRFFLGGVKFYLSQTTIVPDSESNIEINFECEFENIPYNSKRTTPNIAFSVILENETHCKRRFKLHFDENKEERVLYGIIKKIITIMDSKNFIPVFECPKVFNEVFFASDCNEANRLICIGLEDFKIKDVFSDLDKKNVDSIVKDHIRDLQIAYKKFLLECLENGWLSALNNSLNNVIVTYRILVNDLQNEKMPGGKLVLRRLYKAFLIIPFEYDLDAEFLPSAIVTAVTPAVCELVKAREDYLADCFHELIVPIINNQIKQTDASKEFEHFLDMTQIHRPLVAIVENNDLALSSKIRSFGFIHCLGKCKINELSVISQSMMREKDEEVEESQLYKRSSESNIIEKVYTDYLRLRPHSQDAIAILGVNIVDVQPLIAGIHHILKNTILSDSKESDSPYRILLKLYSNDISPAIVDQSLKNWQQYWNLDQASKRLVRIEIGFSHILNKEDLLQKVKEEIHDYDLCFITRFMETDKGGDKLRETQEFCSNYLDRKFPISELPLPIEKTNKSVRKVLLSNRRFEVPTLHTLLSCQMQYRTGKGYVVEGNANFTKAWKKILEECHKKSEWVACIDPYFDKFLLFPGGKERKIVGCACGLGGYGELNLTVSTEKDTMTAVIGHVENGFKRLFPDWDKQNIKQASIDIVESVDGMIGLSLLNMSNANERVRDIIAYGTINKILFQPENASSNILIPLDSFAHWFNEVDMRPDLLQLVVTILHDGRLEIHANLIECKLAKKSEVHRSKAFSQINEGLKQLTRNFLPNIIPSNVKKYDQRYWWAQLYRVIVSQSEVDEATKDSFYNGLEKLADGDFDITWGASVVYFQTDQNTPIDSFNIEQYQENIELNIFDNDHEIVGFDSFNVNFIEIGQNRLENIFKESFKTSLPESVSRLVFKPNKAKNGKETPTSNNLSKETEKHEEETSPQTESQTPQDKKEGTTNGKIQQESTDTEPNVNQSDQANPPESKTQGGLADTKLNSMRILIGQDHKTNQGVFWEYGHKGLTNRHIIIFGLSGEGKTYAIQALLLEMAKSMQNSLIIDYTNGFLPNQIEPEFNDFVKPTSQFVRKTPLSINPFKPQKLFLDGLGEIMDDPNMIAARVANVFKSVYPSMGDQQFALLIKTITDGVSSYKESFNMANLLALLESEEGNSHAGSLANKLTPFINLNVFSNKDDTDWSNLLKSSDKFSNILQLAHVPSEIQKLIIEFVLWDLWNYAQVNGNKNIPLPVVLDEIQNLDHRLESPLAKILTEGRKFGFSLILATQNLSNLNQEERDRLFQACHMLFFRPPGTAIKTYAELLFRAVHGSDKNDWSAKLSGLSKGQCISMGPALQKNGTLKAEAHIVNVTALGNRI